MITFKINDKPLQIPTSWTEVTYQQYLEILVLKDDVIYLVSIFTGLEYDYLKKATLLNLDKLLESLSFVNTVPKFPGSVSECGPYKIPNNAKGQFNIQYESLGQFEDARQVTNKMSPGALGLTEAYGKIVSIYLQKIRDKVYDPLKVPELEDEIWNFPAYQVITLGAFFFLKLRTSLNGTAKTSPPTPPNPKKKVSKSSRRNSVRTRK